MNKLEWNGQVVITTELLAKAYEVNSNTILNAYHRNKKRFKTEKHFYKLSSLSEIKSIITNRDNTQLPKQMLLWTERGAWNIGKILNTDIAWKQYDLLVETYFKVQEFKKLVSEAEYLRLQEHNKQLETSNAFLKLKCEKSETENKLFKIDTALSKYGELSEANGLPRVKPISYLRSDSNLNVVPFCDELGLFGKNTFKIDLK